MLSAGAKKEIAPYRGRVPVCTLVILAGGILTYVLPGLPNALVYDRSEILAGGIWRLFTGHWVHFSASHLFFNLLAIGVAGCVIEVRRYPHFPVLCVLSGLAIGTGLLVLEPGMHNYGGLSGLATSAFYFLALHGMKERGPLRWLCVSAFLIMTCKIFYELWTGQAVFVESSAVPFVPAVQSHVMGALMALMVFGWSTGPSLLQKLKKIFCVRD